MTANISDSSGESQARRLETAADQLTTLVRQPEVARRLSSAPNENDWSTAQILAHIVEMIPYWMSQCRTLIAASGAPPHFGRPPDAPERLAALARGTTENAKELVAQLNDEVKTAARVIRQMSPAERTKTGIHVRLGTMTVADGIEKFIVSHAEEHLAQVRAALSM